ncbi:hypothetical protein [Mycolicibacterium holsaticum]|uniref:hypothetical protein n=1 Tax=Mycolicibacterium holsaticum TaxID=152142 RepID=UPI0013F4BF9C|nr:hypothetical protein [Mycolicibacterium holsaticum]
MRKLVVPILIRAGWPNRWKPSVEPMVHYVRNNLFAGEQLADVRGAQDQAVR